MDANIQIKEHTVSFFKDIYSKEKSKDIPFTTFVEEVKSDMFRQTVEQIRFTMDRAQQNKLKTSISAISVSSIVRKYRKQEDIISHTGLMQIDIDEISVAEASKVKETLIQDPYTFSCFYSPSGKIKIVVQVIPDLNLHKAQFNELVHYYREKYNITCDESVKDVNRLMYYSWDPEIYYNPNSLQFKNCSNIKKVDKKINLGETQNNAIQVIELIERGNIDITGSHSDWIKIIYSLIDIFGEKSGEYIHRISKYYPTYDYSETQSKIDACLKSNGEGITKDTFFFYAKNNGVVLSPKSHKNGKEKFYSSTKSNEAYDKRFNKFFLAKEYISEKYNIRFNTVGLDFEYKQKQSKEPYKTLNENNLYIELQENGLSISFNNLIALLKSDFVVRFDPICAYFENLPPWDGFDHIEKLGNYVKAVDQKAFLLHFKKWLVRVLKCAIDPQYFNKQAFILYCETQNDGKTTFLRFLCPPILAKYIIENISVDKDSKISLAMNLFVNQDELASMLKADLKAFKSMFSLKQVNERLPYDKKNSILPRRASFMGSVDHSEFLTDESGTVRWLCFEISSINWEYSKAIDINKVWAQAYHLLNSNSFDYDLTKEEIAENDIRNRDLHISTIEEILIEKYFTLTESRNDKFFLQSNQVTRRLLELTDNKYKINPIGIGKALKFLGYKKIKHSKFQVYGYYIKEY